MAVWLLYTEWLAGWCAGANDPRTRLLSLGAGVDAYITRPHEGEEFGRAADPVNVGDDGDSVPVGKMLHADLDRIGLWPTATRWALRPGGEALRLSPKDTADCRF